MALILLKRELRGWPKGPTTAACRRDAVLGKSVQMNPRRQMGEFRVVEDHLYSAMGAKRGSHRGALIGRGALLIRAKR